MGSRDPLDQAGLAQGAGERWARIQVVDETGSTNADLLHDASAPDRSVLVAESQTAGRGRFDRSWVSPPGAGLTFSVLVRPAVVMSHWGWLPLLAGVAVAEGVTAVAPGLDVALKWPNDLLLAAAGAQPGKAGGILVQSADDAVVIGIGLNVSTTAEELAVATATSLALCGAEVGRADVLRAVLARLDARYAQWADCNGDAEASGLAAAYRERCATIGSEVSVATGGAELRGRAVDVDPAGRLVVDADGELTAVAAGDVQHIRPAEPLA